MGPRFWGPKIASFLIFFAKTLFFTWAKTCTCWLSKQPFCTNMHKNLLGTELRWHEGKIIRILDLTSVTAPSQKPVRNVSLWDSGCEDDINGYDVTKISECISCHHLVRASITLLDIQSKVAIACQCNSFPAKNSGCFCQHFFHFLGHHFWVPFLGPIFGAPYHFKRKFDWSWRL